MGGLWHCYTIELLTTTAKLCSNINLWVASCHAWLKKRTVCFEISSSRMWTSSRRHPTARSWEFRRYKARCHCPSFRLHSVPKKFTVGSPNIIESQLLAEFWRTLGMGPSIILSRLAKALSQALIAMLKDVLLGGRSTSPYMQLPQAIAHVCLQQRAVLYSTRSEA